VQWNDVVDVHLLNRGDRVAYIVFLVRREVKAADYCMNFVTPETA
jgi:hypothetical protein